jgi:hypothetical protein
MKNQLSHIHSVLALTGMVLSVALRGAPTNLSDDFVAPANWPVAETFNGGTLTLANHRLGFTSPSTTEDAAATTFWSGSDLPTDKDWSVSCHVSLAAFPIVADQYIAMSFGVAKKGSLQGPFRGVELSRYSSDGFGISADYRDNGLLNPSYSATHTTGDVVLRTDFRASTHALSFFIGNDVAGPIDWALLETIDISAGDTNMYLTSADKLAVYLRARALEKAVTDGMATFRKLEVSLYNNYSKYSDWAAAMFTPAQLADPAISGPNADPGDTGAINLLRYAFDLPPPGTGLTGPVTPLTVAKAGGSSYLSILIHRRASGSDIRYVVEASSDLKTWTTQTTFLPAYPRDFVFQDTVDLKTTSRRFLRVRVETLP